MEQGSGGGACGRWGAGLRLKVGSRAQVESLASVWLGGSGSPGASGGSRVAAGVP